MSRETNANDARRMQDLDCARDDSKPTLADCNHCKGREKAASGQTHPAACLGPSQLHYTSP